MAKTQAPPFRCGDCGWTTTKWVGRCGECQAWGTVEEVGAVRARTTATTVGAGPAVPIPSVDVATAHAVPPGVSELDRVLYATGEESAAQVRLRAERIGAVADDLYLAAETDLGNVLGHVDAVEPTLLILDSVQTVSSAEVDGAAGGVTQVKEVAASLISVAKARGVVVILVGHVTKDGTVAGPRTLEHLVDVVLHFEGDRHGPLRLVRAVKNRFGAADEIGCFELVDDGIIGLSDPSGLFLGDRTHSAPGTCVTVTMEGRRPLLAEVQALVAPTSTPQPRRVTSGLDNARVAMMLGVLERRAGVKLAQQDCFTATVGGVRLAEPATDLAVALALASSAADAALPSGLVALGEVGLAGDVRPVTSLARRLSEAARLGFTDAIIPAHRSTTAPAGLTVHEVSTLQDALRVARRLSTAKEQDRSDLPI